MKTLYAIVLPLLVMAAGCQPDAPAGSEGKLNVVATTSIIADLASEIGGDAVFVTGLMGPGVDPHLYQATEGDVGRLTGADVVVYHGLHLEGKMAEIFERLEEGGRSIFAVTRNADESALLDFAGYANTFDPHIWFDLSMWRNVGETVRDEFMRLDPDNAATYQANATAYLARMDSLHAYTQGLAQSVPEEQRVLVTAHDAFQYFGRAYGFQVRGLQGISTASEAGTGDVKELTDFIVDRKIRAIFVESSVPARNIEAVQAAVRSRGWDVVIGGSLYSDALGSAGTPQETYLGTCKHNIETIAAALKGAGPS